jgi:hypothetical protein
MIKRYLLNQLVWMDIAVNAIAGGSPYETVSERAWRHQWKFAIFVLDHIFGQGHCENAEEGNEAQYEILK